VNSNSKSYYFISIKVMFTAVCDLFCVSTLPATQMESLFTNADKRFFSASVECQNYTENLFKGGSVMCNLFILCKRQTTHGIHKYNYFLHFRQEFDYKGTDVILTIISCMTPRRNLSYIMTCLLIYNVEQIKHSK